MNCLGDNFNVGLPWASLNYFSAISIASSLSGVKTGIGSQARSKGLKSTTNRSHQIRMHQGGRIIYLALFGTLVIDIA